MVNVWTAEHGDGGTVERDGIDHEGDERPGLLGVPLFVFIMHFFMLCLEKTELFVELFVIYPPF